MKVFITGVTGFLGKQFLLELLKEDNITVYMTVRSKRADDVHKQLLQLGIAYNQKIILVKLDIGEPVDTFNFSSIPEDIDEFWHIAGLTDFHESKREQLFQVNVGGTRNVISLAKKINVRCFFHISTAYVSGICDGPVQEDGLLHSPTFRNPYEETKYEAECLIRKSGLPFIIIRPSIIMGDSRTGEISVDKMIYGIFKTYHIVWRLVNREYRDGLPKELKYYVKGNPSATKNLICVDDVVRLMLEIRRKGEIGRTYHCTNPQTIPIGKLHEIGLKLLDMTFLEMKGDFSPDVTDSKQRIIDRGMAVYQDYLLRSDPIFDQTNLNKVTVHTPVAMDFSVVWFLFDVYLKKLNKTSKGNSERSMG
jgi:nucleoside-diphosphate-sugar epimerase